jgi:CheY-like chemotaxis protein
LPAVQHQGVAKPIPPPTALPSGHGELILVVDDEQAVLEITKEILEVRGYRVLTATNGADAVSKFAAAAKGSIQLVLTDVNMPGMDGPTAVEAIRKLDPSVKVIIASGLVADLDPVNTKELQIQGYLMKPYTSERMLTMIHESLGT